MPDLPGNPRGMQVSQINCANSGGLSLHSGMIIHFILHLFHRTLHLVLWACALLLRIYLLPLQCIWRSARGLNEHRTASGHLPSSGQQYVYEITQFPTTQAYSSDPNLIKKVTEFLGTHAPGP